MGSEQFCYSNDSKFFELLLNYLPKPHHEHKEVFNDQLTCKFSFSFDKSREL